MALDEKIALLQFSDAEKAKMLKFMASLAYVTTDEMKSIIEFLNTKGVEITLAHELTIFSNPLEDIKRKFSILEEIHVSDIYVQNPLILNKNAIEIYKRIKYCIQIGKSYKKEDGTYEKFLFNDLAWLKEINKENTVINDNTKVLEKTVVTVEPVIDNVNTQVENTKLDVEPIVDLDHIDIKEYMQATSEAAEIEAKTTNFETIRQELKAQLNELDALKNMSFDDNAEIGFNDIQPESYGMGRAA